MATPKKPVHDGIINGILAAHSKKCSHCGSSVWGIAIDRITLPAGIDPSNRLIGFETVTDLNMNDTFHPVLFLGIGCGCYAKFHRQVAHIQGRMKKS